LPLPVPLLLHIIGAAGRGAGPGASRDAGPAGCRGTGERGGSETTAQPGAIAATAGERTGTVVAIGGADDQTLLLGLLPDINFFSSSIVYLPL
jgi:hypothetical protein